MTAGFGIGLFFIGMTITIVGFFIAYCVAYNVHKKANTKREPSPLDGILGWKGADCQSYTKLYK